MEGEREREEREESETLEQDTLFVSPFRAVEGTIFLRYANGRRRRITVAAG